MPTKAEITTQFIIEKVAPVFNRMGYVATSMKDITEATGLTKGAVYGNFENKEHLAIEAFNYNIRNVIGKLSQEMDAKNSPSEKLIAVCDFYRGYITTTDLIGGCPLLNVGVDTNHLNSKLHRRVHLVLKKLQRSLAAVLQSGIETGEFKESIDPEVISLRIISMIEGAVFTATMLSSKEPLNDTMDHIEKMIKTEITN